MILPATLEKYRLAQARLVSERKIATESGHTEVAEPIYDFYRCLACNRLMTKLEEFELFDPLSARFGTVCPCGYRRYSPTNPRWYEYFYPRVMKFAAVRLLRIA